MMTRKAILGRLRAIGPDLKIMMGRLLLVAFMGSALL